MTSVSDPAQIASAHGIVSVLIGVAIPIVLWLLLMRNWRPRTKYLYALKFAFWPIVILTFYLGGPISRIIFGIESKYMMDINRTLKGLIGLFIITAPVFFAIGWWRARKLLSVSKEESGLMLGRTNTNNSKDYIIAIVLVILIVGYTSWTSQNIYKNDLPNEQLVPSSGTEIHAVVSTQSSQGVTEQDFSIEFLQALEKWLVEGIEKKLAAAIDSGKTSAYITDVGSVYTDMKGKKLAVIRIRSDIDATVSVIGIRGDELIRVTCVRRTTEQIPITSGACYLEISEAFSVYE